MIEVTSDQRAILNKEGFREKNEEKPGLFSKETDERTIYIDLRREKPVCYAFKSRGRKDRYPTECDRIINAVMAMNTQQTKLPLG